MTGSAYLRVVGIGALIGIPAAFVAAAFLAVVHQLESWLWDDLPRHLGATSPPWYLVVGLPTAGAVIVVAARRFLPGDGGHRPLDGIGGSPTPPSAVPGVVLAAIGTLAFGAVLGPEAPLIALGSAVGMAFAPMARGGSRERAVLGSAGSFSAVSALFGGPLVAGVLLLEGGIGMGAALIPVLLPGLVSAAIGYLIIVGLGNWGGLGASTLSVSGLPPYRGEHVRDLVVALVVGVVTALVVAAVRRIAVGVDGRGLRRLGMPVLLVAGGAAVGILAIAANALGADSQEVLFSGQSSLTPLVATTSVKVVLVLILAKGLGFAICLGCGFRGGSVFPAIFLGVALTTLAVIVFDVSPTLAVAVGSAAGMAAITRLLFAPLVLATLLVGSQGADAIPAAVVGTAAVWLTLAAVDRSGGQPTAVGVNAGH
jgi:H+/Cl- antiporter ClcA